MLLPFGGRFWCFLGGSPAEIGPARPNYGPETFLRYILYDCNFPFGFWLNGLFCNCCTRAAALPCTWIKERRCTRDLVVSPWPYRNLSPPTPWGHRRVLLLSFHLSLLSTHFPPSNSLPAVPKNSRGGGGQKHHMCRTDSDRLILSHDEQFSVLL